MRHINPLRRHDAGQNSRRGFLWSLGGAVLASLCCVGPLVAILVAGGTAAGTLGLVRFKLEFIAVGLVVTLLGIALSVRRSKASCSVRAYRRNRILIPAVSLLTFALLVAGSNLLLLNDRIIDAASDRLSRDAGGDAGAPQLSAPTAHRLEVAITAGVYCPACLLAIQKAVADTPGVQGVTFANGADGHFVARIVYDPDQVDQPTLLTTIETAPGALTGTYGTEVLADGPAA